MCLERYDVLNDTMAELRQDIKFYRKKQSGEPSDVIQKSMSRSSMRQPIYDAFVCYTSEDWPTVEKLVDRLESKGFRLFLPKRDLKAGVLQYSTFYELMEKWCRKTIIVFSPEFLQSEECRVQQRFIESINIGQRQQKLIPVIIKPCELDGTTRMFSKISLCDDRVAEWGWNKLIESIRCRSDSLFVSAPHSCILPAAPSSPMVVPPSLVVHSAVLPRKPGAVPARTHSKDSQAVVTNTAVNKSGVFRRLGNLFGRKKANSVSSASSGFQSMAVPE
ncbi:hypothetical protein V5799_006164 [Amblyomma americanum]|uniref:TIR domain-containing protein n=1 Tax=Amblyomma americanum TaxID=6943 RepID=A0AAQ4DX62_AMBAM